MDRFFISFQFEEEMLQNYSSSSNPLSRAPRRQALMKQDVNIRHTNSIYLLL